MVKRFTHEAVKHFVEIESNSGCKLLSKEYINSITNLDIICRCGNLFSTTFKIFKRENNHIRHCKECGKKMLIEKLSKTHEQFCTEVYELVKDDYLILSKYIDYRTYVQMKHVVCGFEYQVTPANFISGGYRCPKCAGNIKLTTEEFKRRIYEKYGDEYEVLGEYINNHIKIKMKHNICNEEYMIAPNDILSGNRCYTCSGLERKNIDIIRKEVYELVNDEYTVDGNYINNKTKLTFTHKTCGKTFPMNTNNFLNGQRCPICAESKGEQYIRKYLELHNIYFVPQKEYHGLVGVNNGNLSYDFFIPKYNLLIEFQGIQHEQYREGLHKDKREFKKQLEHDKRKKEYVKNNNINFLEIWYYDIDNIETILSKELINYKQ